uniref:Uncharacterized protein n=1 Tax=Stomoxys calcitrans TaxID=35570 RepID=A0A1I8PB88_STOCA
MDVVLTYKIKNEKKFFDCAFKLGIDEMSAHKFLYITHQSDLDIFPKMGDERLNILLYLWEICEDYKVKLNEDEWELPEELETMLKIIVPWSLDIWFSKEWDRCKILLRHALVHCLNRARSLLMRLPDMMQINWDFLLLYNQTPWQVIYLKSLNVTKEKTLETGALTIETEEHASTNEDIAYLKLEQLPLIVLRLVKLFDQSSIDMVKTLCMRVIAAWNKVYYTELNQTGGSRLPYVPPEDKRCLLLICHIYLMAVYEADDVKGYVIDNMMHNIRFYNQGFQTSYAMDNMQYTPARLIALTCLHLRLQKREFFDFFIWNSFDTSLVNLFGVVSQAYKSYLLGNLLLELNNMNDDDFAANVALYKRLMNAYINEREKSELFMLNELQKLEAQHYAHNIIQCVANMTDYKSKICKGNRMSNIGNYENTDDISNENVNRQQKLGLWEIDADEDENKDDLRQDPIFQTIPNNAEILYNVYEVLSKKSYNGWHFAKIVLLFKIISHELNMIETWRYHPGLTTNFMLNLETKLSHHYTDLAKIFAEHPFIEQEFSLTAFYLNPTNYNYEQIKRLGIRNNRRRTDEQGRWVTGKDKIDAKYGLLSSTIDVKEITNLSNPDEQREDYEPLFEALSSLHLPTSMVKDIITVVFLARNKSFSWAVDWGDLRRRCKMLMSNPSEKERFVELSMDEANNRLKFLKIDYEKYKNRPQLDYGTIEQGYESLINAADSDDDDMEESEEEDDFEDDEDVYETRKERGVKKPDVVEDENSQEDDPYLTGKRRTRARAAAAMASILFNSEMGTRRKRRKKDEDEAPKEEDAEKSDDFKSTADPTEPPPSIADDASSKNSDIAKKNIKECLKERPVLVNPTYGFQPLIDIWNVEKSDLAAIDNDCVYLLESSSVLQRFSKLKTIAKEINPTAICEEEVIQEMENLIAQSPTRPVKVDISENIRQAIKLEEIEESRLTVPAQIIAKRIDEVNENAPEQIMESPDTQDTQQTSHQSTNNANEENREEISLPTAFAESCDTSTIADVENAVAEKTPMNMEIDIEEKTPMSDDETLPCLGNGRKEVAKDYEVKVQTILENNPNELKNSSEIEIEDYKELSSCDTEPNLFEAMENATVDKIEENIKSKSHEKVNENNEKLIADLEIAIVSDERKLDTNVVQPSELNTTTIETEGIHISTEEDSMEKLLVNQSDTDSATDERTVIEENNPAKEVEMLKSPVLDENNGTESLESDHISNQLSPANNEFEQIITSIDKDISKSEQELSLGGYEILDLLDKTIEEIEQSNKLNSQPNDELIQNRNQELNSKEPQEKPAKDEEGNTKSLPSIEPHTNSIEEDIIEDLEAKQSTDTGKEKILDTNLSISKKETIEKSVLQQVAVRGKDKILENPCLGEAESNEDQNSDLHSETKPILKSPENPKSQEDILTTAEDEQKENEPQLQNKNTSNDDAVAISSAIIQNDNNETNCEQSQKDATYIDDQVLLPHDITESEIDDLIVYEPQKESEANISELSDIAQLIDFTDWEEMNQMESAIENINEAIVDNKTAKNSNKADFPKGEDMSANEAKVDDSVELMKVEDDGLITEGCENKEECKIAIEILDGAAKAAAATQGLKMDVDEPDISKDMPLLSSFGDNSDDTEPKPIIVEDDVDLSAQGNDMPLLDAEEILSGNENTIAPQVKRFRVLIPKLRPCDLVNLRQPKVRLKRLQNIEIYLKAMQKTLNKNVFLDFDESSENSLQSSSSDTYRPPKGSRTKPPLQKRHTLRNTGIIRTSDSDCDSTKSQLSTRNRRSCTPNASSSQSNNSAGSTSRPPKVKNLVVTPRSASGLKLRISHAMKKSKISHAKPSSPSVDEIIQLSSSSNDTNTMDSIAEVIEIPDVGDPLFEEEIII